MSEWHKIETAPKDGKTRVLLTYWDLDFMWFYLGLYDQSEGAWEIYGSDGEKCYPTHWMPLPSPPVDGESTDRKEG